MKDLLPALKWIAFAFPSIAGVVAGIVGELEHAGYDGRWLPAVGIVAGGIASWKITDRNIPRSTRRALEAEIIANIEDQVTSIWADDDD